MFPHRIRLPVVNLDATVPVAGAPAAGPVPAITPASGGSSPTSEWSWRVEARVDEIEGLAADWRRLFADESAPCLAFSRVRAWYRQFAGTYQEQLVFVVSRAGRPAAIFPCCRRGREIRLAGDSTRDCQDMIAADDEAATMGLRLLIAWARRRRPGCDLVFEKLSSRGRLCAVVNSLENRRAEVFVLRRRHKDGFTDGSRHEVFSFRLMPRTVFSAARGAGIVADGLARGVGGHLRRLAGRRGKASESEVAAPVSKGKEAPKRPSARIR